MMEEKRMGEGREKAGEGGGGREIVLFEGKQGEMVAGEQQAAKEYPAPLFDHNDLCGDPAIFVEALRSFHSFMGTKFMIPVIGGRDLDLHRLYVEVANRGGLEKVIVEKRWREVISIFNFPPTTTSASFVLRKYYLSLLHHFEQVYLFGVRGRPVPPSAALQTRAQLSKFDDVARSDTGTAMRRKRAFPPVILPGSASEANLGTQTPNGNISAELLSLEAQPQNCRSSVESPPLDASKYGGSNSAAASSKPLSVDRCAPPHGEVHSYPTSSSTPPVDSSMPSATGGIHNFTVSGTIDGKFDHGYFVTVKIGSQLLHGVLYHIHQELLGVPSISPPPVNPFYQTPPPSSFPPATKEGANVPYIPSTRSAGRRQRLKKRDPAHPKPNRSAYNFFFAQKHFELKAQCPNMEREYSKRIGESWSKLTDEEKQIYEDYARRDKERYRKDLLIYKERFKFAEPKQSEVVAGKVEFVRKEGARTETHDCTQRLEIAQLKETATCMASREEVAGKSIELEKELVKSAMETDLMDSNSADENIGS